MRNPKKQSQTKPIEEQVAKLRGPSRRATESEARLNELREIHKLTVNEKATQTVDRLDRLVMGIQHGSVRTERPVREGEPRQQGERPARQENN